MKLPLSLLAASTLLAAALHAADPVGINTLAAQPGNYASAPLTVVGHIDRVSAAKHMVVLIDSSEATCQDGCSRKTLIVEIPADAPLPAKGQTLTATGQLAADTTQLRLTATNIAVTK